MSSISASRPSDLGLVGHQLGQQAAEPDRLGAQVLAHERVARAGRVALVEDQVDDGEHGAQPRRAGRPRAGRGTGSARRGSCPWRARAAAPSSAPGRGTRARSRPCVSPPSSRSVSATCAARRQRRVAAGEDQPQPVVVHGTLLLRRRLAGAQQRAACALAVLARRLAAQPVDRAVARRGDDPAGRARRQPALGPAPHRLGERVLDRLLGDVDVAEDADQDGHRAAVLLAEDTLDVHVSRVRRTGGPRSAASMASAILPAHASAASRSGASMIVKPPTCSLPSANGPSVSSVSPSWWRTTVAVLARVQAAGEHPHAGGLHLLVSAREVAP